MLYIDQVTLDNSIHFNMLMYDQSMVSLFLLCVCVALAKTVTSLIVARETFAISVLNTVCAMLNADCLDAVQNNISLSLFTPLSIVKKKVEITLTSVIIIIQLVYLSL